MEGSNYSDRLAIAANQQAKEREYWLNKLSGNPVKSHFPYDTENRGKINASFFDRVSLSLSGHTFSRLMALSKNSDYSLNTILAAGITLLLYRYTDNTDIILGEPIYKQESQGDFINTVLILRNQLQEQMTFKELLLQMRQVIYEATEHQDYPLEVLLEQLNIKKTGNDCPLFDTVLLLENIHDEKYIRQIHVNTRFSFSRKDDHLEGLLEYNPLRYKRPTIERIVNCFKQLFQEILNNLDLQLSTIDILPGDDRKRLLIDFNNNRASFSREKTVCQFIQQHSETTPGRICIACNGKQLTYGDLNKESNQLARLLRDKGVNNDCLIGILCERSLEMVIGILAAWKAGGAYIPIDINDPFDRIKAILADSDSKILLTKSSHYSQKDKFYMEIALQTNIAHIIYLDKEKSLQSHNQHFKTLRYSLLLQQGFELPPDKDLVLEYETQTITFQECTDQIKQISQFVTDRAIAMGSPVALMFDNPIYKIITIMYLNSRHIPFILLDPRTGRERKKQRIENSAITTIFSESRFLDELDQLLWESTGFKNYILLDNYDTRQTAKEFHFKEIWDYVAEETSEAINDYGWSNSYTNEPFTIEEMNEYIQNFKVKLAPYLTPQTRTLDIGCGHGLVMFEIAPLVGYYLATDLSPVIIEKNKSRLQREGLHHVELKRAAASEINSLEEKNFDIIVCSSVIHYFPNTLFLEEVIKYAIDLLKDEGIIYLDDIMNLRKKRELIQSTLDYKSLNPQVQVKIDWDSDLFVDVDFFHDMQQKYPEILQWESSPKMGRIENELTKFRYDVLLKIDKKAKKDKPVSLLKKNRHTIRDIQAHCSAHISTKSRNDFVNIGFPQGKKPLEPNIIGNISDIDTIETYPGENSHWINHLSHLSYVIYTSGSTGAPKGVMVEHFGMMNHLQAKINDLQITGNSIIAQNASHTFDISVWQFFAALVTGGQTMIYDNELVLDPDQFISRFIKEQVTILELVPSYLAVMLEFLDANPRTFNSLDYLLVTGEEIKPGLVDKWFKKYPGIKMVNAYGPTEASDDITHFFMDGPGQMNSVPIGKPVQNLCIYIVDKHMNLCPIGVTGEIWTSGIGVGRGYLNNIKKTKMNFISNPFDKEKGVRLYKTGDLGYWLEEGNIIFCGRKDYQVKIRGFRIELGEIEIKLAQHPAVKEAVVLDRNDDQGNKYLCAYLVPGENINIQGIKEYMLESLPDYMIPAYFVELEKIPLTPNGKIDRKSLPGPQTSQSSGIIYLSENQLRNIALNLENNQNKEKLTGTTKIETELEKTHTISKEEKNRLLYAFNNNKVDFPPDISMHELFEAQVKKTPDNTAVIFEDKWLTYNELNGKSNQLASILRLRGVTPNSIIGIIEKRSIELIIGIMAILKAGGAFMAVDPQDPSERINYILEDSKPELLLTHSSLKENNGINFNGQILNINEKELFKGDSTNLDCINKSSDIVYIMYTSGSTGLPKGVMIQHDQFVNIIYGWQKEYHLKEVEINVLQIFNFTFDVSAGDLARALIFGGKLVICLEKDIIDYSLFALFLNKHKITMFESTPSLIIPFMDCVFEHNLKINYLKLLIIGSDVCKPIDYKRLVLRFGKKMRILNSYGVTEATIDSSYYEEKDPEKIPIDKNLPIGKPLPNVKYYVLNAKNCLQPIGIAGQLHIGGKSIARSYLRRENLTSEKFVPDPFSPGERIYKTGDMARWLADGNLEFIGRIDNQVKIRGFRIELGEIENCILTHHNIKEAVVVAKESGEGERSLLAFVVSNVTLMESELKGFLSKKLPYYMIPLNFYQLEKMPLSKNGKINRRLLKAVDIQIKKENKYQMPRDPVEKKLLDIWSEVLGIDKSVISKNKGIDTNFFELGGHSLKATILIAKINKTFNVKVSLAEIFRISTIKTLGEYIKKAKQSKYASIEPVEKKEYYALSSAQQRLYVLHQIASVGIAYNMTMIVQLEVDFYKDRLEKVFKDLITRHDNFRTSYHMFGEKIVQRVHENFNFKVNYFAAEREEEVQTLINHFVKAFDLSQAPLLRVGIITSPAGTNTLIVDTHHIISDGVSHNILISDFMDLYEEIPLPGLKLQYRDYSEWMNSKLQRERVKQQESYWLQLYSDDPPVLLLPTDYPRPPVQSFEGSSIRFTLSKEDTGELKNIAREEGTLYMCILAIFNILLAKLSGQEDIIVGTPTAGRRHPDLESIVGMFINTITIRNYPRGNKTFRQFLKELKEQTLKAFENQEYPFETLVDKIGIKRDTSRNPLFDVMLNLLNQEESPRKDQKGDEERQFFSLKEGAKFDLNLKVIEQDERLVFRLEYSTQLFKSDTIARLIIYFKRIVASILSDPDKAISGIEIIDPAEKEGKLQGFNEILADDSETATIQGKLSESFQKYGNNIAVEHGTTQLSYGQLNRRSTIIANRIIQSNIKPGSFIGIYINDKVEIISIVIGILKANCVFVPLDRTLPRRRIENMIRQTNLEAIFIDVENRERLLKENGFNTLSEKSIKTFILDDSSYQKKDDFDADVQYKREDPVYIYFTSGTTDIPKGIVGKNKSLLHFIQWEIDTFKISPACRVSQFSAVGFDAFLRDIFTPLLAGGTICIPETRDLILNREALIKWIDENRIHLIHFVPTVFRILNCEYLDSKNFSHLKYILLAGEPINPKELEKWYKIFDERIQLVNLYGQTETTMAKTCYFIHKHDVHRNKIPVGNPIRGAKLLLLDKNMNICPPGIVGEIYIRTPYATSGYYNDVELNKRHFIPNPFQQDGDDGLYKTGDLGRELADGNIELIDRQDGQVKIRGNRIELQEIETLLLKYEGINEAVLVAKGDEEEKYLCAYIAADNEIAVSELRKYLSTHIPDYMIPSYFIHINKIPLTPNGKIDRKALPEPKIETQSHCISPRDEVEDKLAGIWAEVLGMGKKSISVDADFFELGGHSLKATIMMAKIHKDFSLVISFLDLFRNPTIQGIAALIKAITWTGKKKTTNMQEREKITL